MAQSESEEHINMAGEMECAAHHNVTWLALPPSSSSAGAGAGGRGGGRAGRTGLQHNCSTAIISPAGLICLHERTRSTDASTLGTGMGGCGYLKPTENWMDGTGG